MAGQSSPSSSTKRITLTYDHQVDATSQALNWLTARTPLGQPLVRKDVRRRDIARRSIMLK